MAGGGFLRPGVGQPRPGLDDGGVGVDGVLDLGGSQAVAAARAKKGAQVQIPTTERTKKM